jgi:Asp-tRNA(Asn)/Glu-tRNA(Gln) amidotransferase A subunit family amidase
MSSDPLRTRSVELCRKAIDERNGDLRAILRTFDPPMVSSEAAPDAPLRGVPYVLKDTWKTKGIATTGGSWRYRDHVPDRDSVIHQTFQRAGGTLLGKSSLADMAFSFESANHLLGAVSNPYDPSRTSGGSTGGGAAAVAAGMAAFDWGSDFGGSVRMPAGFCGVVGLRLSHAAWPLPPGDFFPTDPKLDLDLHGMGPIACTVQGVRAVMEIARPSLAKKDVSPFRASGAVVYRPEGRAVGEWPTFVSDACRALLEAGTDFDVDRSLPPPSAVEDAYNGYLCANFDAFLAVSDLPLGSSLGAVALALASRGKLDQRFHPNTAILLTMLALGHVTIYRDKKRAKERALRVLDATGAVWGRGKLIVAPTTTFPAPKHGRAVLEPALVTYSKLGNLTDATSIAVPFGRFANGLPRSIQILGPAGSEEAVLDLAARLEPIGKTVR